MKLVTLYSGSTGLNTVMDPQRLSQGSDNSPGMVELAMAVNADIDDRGLVTLRRGYTSKQAGVFHSLFCAGGDCFVVQDRTSDAAIYKVTPGTYTLTGVRSGLAKGTRVSFTQANADTFYSNGAQNGYIRNGVSSNWPVSTYDGEDIGLELAAAPIGRHIAFQRGGLMFISVGNSLYVNHFPFNFGLYSMAAGYVQLETDIIMICPVRQGVYVSDAKATWFFRGTSWFDFSQEKVADYPALEWSLAHDEISPRDMGMDIGGNARIWGSAEGLCLGTDDGTFINLTREKINYPTGYSSGSCLVTDTHIIHTSN